MYDIAGQLKALGHELPPPPQPNGRYHTWTLANGLFLTAGQLSRDGERVLSGVASSEADVPRAQEAARVAVLRCLSLLAEAQAAGARIQNVVSLRGFVACTPQFNAHSRVLDAASELLIAVFGDSGAHVRSAIGAPSLPAHGLVELELCVLCA